MTLTVQQRIRLGALVVDEAQQQAMAEPPNLLWMADLLQMTAADRRAFLIALVTARRTITQNRRTTTTTAYTAEETEFTDIIAGL